MFFFSLENITFAKSPAIAQLVGAMVLVCACVSLSSHCNKIYIKKLLLFKPKADLEPMPFTKGREFCNWYEIRISKSEQVTKIYWQ